MGLCIKFGKTGAVLALLIAIFVGVVKQLDEEPRYEVLSRVLYPFFRFGWSTGLLPTKVMMKKIDDTSFRLIGQATPEEVFSWKLEADDVVVATFAKSGTHLSIQTSLQIMSEASELTGDQMETLHHFVSVPEIVTQSSVVKCNDRKLLHAGNIKELAPLGNKSLFATHLDYHHTPSHKDAKYIVMARDPVDVLLSLHSMVTKIFGEALGPRKEELLPVLSHGSGGWAEFNLEWWKHRHEDNVLFLLYEDAVKDPAAMIATVTKFLGKPADAEVAARVLERSSVKYMKERHVVFDPLPCMTLPFPVTKPIKEGESIMVNKGKSGSGKKDLDEDTRRQIREYCQRVFGGSDFPLEKWPGCN